MKIVKSKNILITCILSMFLEQITYSVYSPIAKPAKLATPIAKPNQIAKPTPKPIAKFAAQAVKPTAKLVAKPSLKTPPPATIIAHAKLRDFSMGGQTSVDPTTYPALLAAINNGETATGTVESNGSLTLTSSISKISSTSRSFALPNKIYYFCEGDAGYAACDTPVDSGTFITIKVIPAAAPQVLSSVQKGYQVYDIYMPNAPKNMRGGNPDTDIIDISKYSYKNPLDGPMFSFNLLWQGKDTSGTIVCSRCDISKGINIDYAHISLPNFPTSWNLPVCVRVHVGQAPTTAPELPSSSIPNPPTLKPATEYNRLTINLNGIPLTSVEFDAGQGFKSINTKGVYSFYYSDYYGAIRCYCNTGTGPNDDYLLNNNPPTDSPLRVNVRINNYFVFYNVINQKISVGNPTDPLLIQ